LRSAIDNGNEHELEQQKMESESGQVPNSTQARADGATRWAPDGAEELACIGQTAGALSGSALNN
jgi:hypothetical protein